MGLIGRGGPALRRRPRSLEAVLLRLRAGTRTRTCGRGPCCLLSSLRASAPARGLRMRGNAQTGRGGNRDGPSLASHCARAAERAAHADDTDGRASSSSAEVPRVYRAKLAPQRRAERAGSTRVRAVERAPHRQRASLCRAHASTPTPPALCAGAGALSSRCARAALARRSRCATRTPASGEPEPWAIHGDGGSSPSSFLPSCCHCAVVTHVAVPSSQLHTTTTHHHPAAPSRATRRGVTGATPRATSAHRAPSPTHGGRTAAHWGARARYPCCRPFFPIAYHHHAPPPRRSFAGDAARGNGGDPAGDVGA